MRIALSFLFALSLTACGSRWEGDTPLRMEFRVARERPAEGLTPMTLEGSRVRLYLHDEVLMTNADLKAAEPGVESGKPVVVLTFVPISGRRWEDITREFKGQRMAVLLDGVLVSAPRMHEVISNHRAVIQGEFSEADAKAIASRLMP